MIKRVLLALSALFLSSLANAESISITPSAGSGPGTTTNLLGFSGYVVNNWYTNPYLTGFVQGAGGVGTAGTTYCTPFWIYAPVHINAIAINVTIASAGNLSAALYNNNASTSRPGTLIDYTASTFGSLGLYSLPLSTGGGGVAVSTGMIWFCVQKNDAIATYRANLPNVGTSVPSVIGSPTLSNALGSGGVPIIYVSTPTAVFGTWPDMTAATWTDGSAANGLAAYGGIQIKSVP
jgi:hypothetical protein